MPFADSPTLAYPAEGRTLPQARADVRHMVLAIGDTGVGIARGGEHSMAAATKTPSRNHTGPYNRYAWTSSIQTSGPIMAFEPRKRRTRQHVIADLSVHHIEGFVLGEGHTAERFGSEYSYDMLMHSFDEAGYAEPGSVYFQLKAAGCKSQGDPENP